MRLFHVTNRKKLPGIAERGFKEGASAANGGIWLHNAMWTVESLEEYPFDIPAGSKDEMVVLEFDIPEAVANVYAEDQSARAALPPDDPDYDPEIDNPEGMPEPHPPVSWVVPPEIANRFFTDLVFWTGEAPLTGGQLKAMQDRAGPA